jgi:ABC-type hemin transport system ATPase subunit
VLSGAYASIGLYQTPTDEIRQKAISLSTELGCLDYANRNYETLSQGERQRIHSLCFGNTIISQESAETDISFVDGLNSKTSFRG